MRGRRVKIEISLLLSAGIAFGRREKVKKDTLLPSRGGEGGGTKENGRNLQLLKNNEERRNETGTARS